MAWWSGRYRVTVQADGETVLAEAFHSTEWFNELEGASTRRTRSD